MCDLRSPRSLGSNFQGQGSTQCVPNTPIRKKPASDMLVCQVLNTMEVSYGAGKEKITKRQSKRSDDGEIAFF